MLIVVRCVGCSRVLADKWNYYERECKLIEEPKGDGKQERTRGQVLDELGLTRICCRRHMLGCVDLMELI